MYCTCTFKFDITPSQSCLSFVAAGVMMRGIAMAGARRLVSNALRSGPSFTRCPFKGATFALQSRSLNVRGPFFRSDLFNVNLNRLPSKAAVTVNSMLSTCTSSTSKRSTTIKSMHYSSVATSKPCVIQKIWRIWLVRPSTRFWVGSISAFQFAFGGLRLIRS